MRGFDPLHDRQVYSEFLDTEWENVKFPSKPLESWRSSQWADEVVILDIHLVRMLAQPKRLREIALSDQDTIADYAMDIKKNGIKEPFVVLIDGKSKMTLQDGHHRLLSADRIGLLKIPVRFEQCPALTIQSVHVSEVIRALVT